MKEILYGDELKKVMTSSVNMICDAVCSTLGPVGSNVLINNSDSSPFITNDGVTIASNIESSDKRVNTILEIIKEASLKTNEVVGDGTTTTLAILQSIFNQGLKEIENGKSSIILRSELNNCLLNILNNLNDMKKVPSKSDLESVASISSNDKETGLFLSKLFFKMKNKYAIKLEEGKKDKTYYEIKKGYSVEIDNISSIYFKENKNIELEDVYISIFKGYLSSLEQISEIVNEAIVNNKNILIFVEEFDESINQELLSYYLSNETKIFIFKLPFYALHRDKLEKDIAYISKCSIKNIEVENISFSDFGLLDNVVINKDEVSLFFDNVNIREYIKEVKLELENTYDDYEKEFIESRLSKLLNGIAIIYVCGNTKTEIKEKIMRFEDALCALQSAKDGVLPGEGIALLKISNNMECNNTGELILKKALQVPFEKIMINSSKNYSKIKEEIIKSNYKKIYNIEKDIYEELSSTKILDPLKVVVESLKNAVSISSILLTTNYLVINENEKLEKDVL